MAEVLVVTSKVKALAKAQDMRMSAEFVDRLSQMVERKVTEAVTAAKTTSRKTVMAEDLRDAP